MTDNITLVGVVATPPKTMQTHTGLAIVSFRLASPQRRYDRARSLWVEGETNWYTVTAFRQLAENAAASLSKGDRVIVSGRVRVRSWENGERSGTSIEVDAESLGPDLLWGTTVFTKGARPAESGDAGQSTAFGQTSGQDPAGLAPQTPSPSPTGLDPARPLTPLGDPPASGSRPDSDELAADRDRQLVGAAGGPAGDWHPATDETPF